MPTVVPEPSCAPARSPVKLFLVFLVVPVYNQTNNVEVESTKQIIEQYQRENRDVIQRNKVKLVCPNCALT